MKLALLAEARDTSENANELLELHFIVFALRTRSSSNDQFASRLRLGSGQGVVGAGKEA